jgi:hypothetical protein
MPREVVRLPSPAHHFFYFSFLFDGVLRISNIDSAIAGGEKKKLVTQIKQLISTQQQVLFIFSFSTCS